MNVRPRHAASLVLVKKERRGHSVLMGKRAKQHKFLPNVYVFPGGRVDPSDQRAEVAKPLAPVVARKLAYPNEHLSHAIGAAAARETWEETGLIIGDVKNGNLVADLSGFDYVARAITPPANPIRFHTRFLVADADHAKGELEGSGELLDLHWVRIEDAFKLSLIDVTEFVLEEVQHYLKEGQSHHQAIPLFGYRNGRPFIRRK
jgi:8-oxo-dGTP pyrophosphatase MutT (NUDIX family)